MNVLNTVSAIGALVMAATPLMAIGSMAHAQDLTPQVIKVGDLDLSRPADRARFDARVDRAAEAMCATPGELIVSADCSRAVHQEAAQDLAASERRTSAPVQTLAAADQ